MRCNMMRHAVYQGLIDNNPAANFDDVTAPPVRRHYHALPLEQLLERIKAYTCVHNNHQT